MSKQKKKKDFNTRYSGNSNVERIILRKKRRKTKIVLL